MEDFIMVKQLYLVVSKKKIRSITKGQVSNHKQQLVTRYT